MATRTKTEGEREHVLLDAAHPWVEPVGDEGNSHLQSWNESGGAATASSAARKVEFLAHPP
ncbi:MAG TPA: hypothetical protein DC060_02050 [Gemmatimonadetes bacterium]|nr:hypothetical protein [Gemmatimonadota bacterium]HBD96963.1 hypothetical protein [Gemmatimonadota bacterium]